MTDAAGAWLYGMHTENSGPGPVRRGKLLWLSGEGYGEVAEMGKAEVGAPAFGI